DDLRPELGAAIDLAGVLALYLEVGRQGRVVGVGPEPLGVLVGRAHVEAEKRQREGRHEQNPTQLHGIPPWLWDRVIIAGNEWECQENRLGWVWLGRVLLPCGLRPRSRGYRPRDVNGPVRLAPHLERLVGRLQRVLTQGEGIERTGQALVR